MGLIWETHYQQKLLGTIKTTKAYNLYINMDMMLQKIHATQ